MLPRSLALTLLLALAALALLAGAAGLSPARAQTGPDATVFPDQLYMRSGPGTEYAIVATLVRGAALTLLARDEVPANGLWLYSRSADGAEGWLLSDYLEIRPDLNLDALPVRPAEGEPTAPEAPPAGGGFPEGTGIPAQTAAEVNLRVGPGTGYRVISTLAVGTAALAKGRDESLEWVFLSVNGQDGWVYVGYLRLLSSDVSGLPLVTTIVSEIAAPAAEEAATAPGAVPAPVAGGVGLTSFGYGGHVDSFARPDLMHDAGMTWVKRQIRYVRGTPGSVAAGAIDQAHANGFKVLLGIVGSASDVIQPGYFEDYARFVGEVAALGPDAIEVWNEQNIDREWANGHIDPASYTQLLALAYNAIKSANPNIAVISGAPAPTGAEGAYGTAAVWNDDRYVRGMAAAGAASYMDCIGAHYNEGIVGPSQTSGDPRDNYYTRYFWGMVNTYYNAFGGARPVCFTELGYLSPEGYGPLPGHYAWGADTTVAEQARWLADAVRLARSSGRVRLVIIWNVDFTNYSGDPMAGYAMIRPGGGCPACDALTGR
ncbi:MAG: SH3 domain-containing protein [Anaerolineae bacterium]|nr:SH3 domain-containing protein [Anaerolineae bacterium]